MWIAVWKILRWCSKPAAIYWVQRWQGAMTSGAGVLTEAPWLSQGLWKPNAARIPEVLLDGLLKSPWEHIIKGWIVNSRSAFCADEVVQLARKAVKLPPHLRLLLYLCFDLFAGLVVGQVVLGPFPTLLYLCKICLAAVVVMQGLATSPSQIELLDRRGTVMKEDSVQALRPLQPPCSCSNSCQPAT